MKDSRLKGSHSTSHEVESFDAFGSFVDSDLTRVPYFLQEADLRLSHPHTKSLLLGPPGGLAGS